jgi:hypothetical protein
MFTMQDALDERWVELDGFWEGYHDGINAKGFQQYQGVHGQAYDRGLQCGLFAKRLAATEADSIDAYLDRRAAGKIIEG